MLRPSASWRDTPKPGSFLGRLTMIGHGRAFHAARGVECRHADVVIGEGLAAVVDLHQDPGRILEVEHRHAEHFPIGVARVRIVGVFDADRPAVLQRVLDLRGDLLHRSGRAGKRTAPA